MEKKLVKIMMNLIRCEIRREDTPPAFPNVLSESVLERLYKLSSAHDLAHIVGVALENNKLLDQSSEIAVKFREQIIKSVCRYERLNCEINQICRVFENAKIPFILLKGAEMRKYYPEAWMRTSCDIDVLLHECDLERASEQLIQKLSYKKHNKGSHDIAFATPSDICLELHYGLIEEEIHGKSGQPLKDIWEKVSTKSGSVQAFMSDETFYYYHVAHMAKHFLLGGCGIRPFIDLWILNNKISYDRNLRQKLITDGGLQTFERTVIKLSEVWFNEEETDELTEKVQGFILSGGVYGNLENRIAIQQKKKGGKFRYLMSRVFMPYNEIKYIYPALQKHKWLLPFFEVRRWFRVVFKGGLKKYSREMKVNKSISEEKKEMTSDLMNSLGL